MPVCLLVGWFVTLAVTSRKLKYKSNFQKIWLSSVSVPNFTLNFWRTKTRSKLKVITAIWRISITIAQFSLGVWFTVKLLIQSGSQIEAGSPLQAGGLGHLF